MKSAQFNCRFITKEAINYIIHVCMNRVESRDR